MLEAMGSAAQQLFQPGPLIAFLIITPIALFNGVMIAGGIPVFALAVAAAFIIQWLAFIPAYLRQTERFYDLTGGVTAGMTDSKVPDAQSGYEKGYNHALVGNSGANLVYESAGMHASLLGACFESFVIDNDSIGSVLRTVRGIEVTEDSLSVEAIRDVCTNGPGHFLGHSQTLSLMQSEYVYPEVGDRTSPKEWDELGKPDLIAKAVARKEEILATQSLARLDPATDRKIRDRFNIHLPD